MHVKVISSDTAVDMRMSVCLKYQFLIRLIEISVLKNIFLFFYSKFFKLSRSKTNSRHAHYRP